MQKGFYAFEYMDDWEIFDESSLPEKEDFYIHPNMENFTNADYKKKTRKKSLQKLRDKKIRFVFDDLYFIICISWFVFSKWYIIGGWCI